MTDRVFTGGAHDDLQIGEIVIGHAWNLRGDPRHEAFVSAAPRVLGVPLPQVPLTSTRTNAVTLLWLGPRSWLHVGREAPISHDYEPARRAVNAAGGALFDVSASYVGWCVSGATVVRVLNRTCPLDLDPRAFEPGRCAQSLLGHVTALFHRPDDAPSFVVMVARSFAADASHALREAAKSDGCRITDPTGFPFAR
jgi:sarcosine oxidase, subunit gamma